MKRCPQCGRDYNDDSLSYCLDDGSDLLFGPAASDEPATALFSEAPTRRQAADTDQTAVLANSLNTSPSTRGLDKRLIVACLGLVLLIAASYFVYRYFDTATLRSINSIAVLPFENRSGNTETDYLSDGIADSLISRLSQLPDLKVSPTSSVMRYKGSSTDVAQIAKELDVDAVLSGRLVQLGDSLDISVQLIDARTRKLLWAEQYDRKMSDLLATQRDIATEITSRLKVKLSGAAEKKFSKTYTQNNEAYQLYLQGRYHWSKRSKEEIMKAVDCYRQAIALDPNYALAYVGIADAYNSMGKDPDLSPAESVPVGKDAAMRALQIDPELAEAHAALADSLSIYDWDWATAGREFDRAIELDPNVGYMHLVHGSSYLGPTRQLDAEVAEMQRSLELEPLSLINNSIMVTGYLYARQNDKALQQARKAMELDPNFGIAYHWLGLAMIANGMYDDAIKLGEQKLQTWTTNSALMYVVGQAYAMSGRRNDAERYISKLRDLSKQQYVRTYWVASIYAALGDKDKAFAELEQSFKDRDCFLPRANVDPAMDALRDDPRFADLIKRMGLPQ